MSLRDWLANRWLVEHTTSPAEIADLLDVVRRDLADAAIEGLSPDWRMGIAYNAALQLATIALAASGYRELAVTLRATVMTWLGEHHPQLLRTTHPTK